MSADRLAEWQADDEIIRARRTQPAGRVPPATARALSGLEMLREMVAGRVPGAPMAESLDFMLVHVSEGEAVFQGRPGTRFMNPMGGLHGGWYATLLDSAVGCAVHTTLHAGRAYTTLEFKMNLVRAIGSNVPLVRAEGRVIHAGRQVATAEGKLLGPDGKLYAHATTTCLIFDLPPETTPP